MNGTANQQEIATNGFTIIENIYSDKEVDSLITLIQQADSSIAWP